jgi:hypothetical protein
VAFQWKQGTMQRSQVCLCSSFKRDTYNPAESDVACPVCFVEAGQYDANAVLCTNCFARLRDWKIQRPKVLKEKRVFRVKNLGPLRCQHPDCAIDKAGRKLVVFVLDPVRLRACAPCRRREELKNTEFVCQNTFCATKVLVNPFNALTAEVLRSDSGGRRRA